MDHPCIKWCFSLFGKQRKAQQNNSLLQENNFFDMQHCDPSYFSVAWSISGLSATFKGRKFDMSDLTQVK